MAMLFRQTFYLLVSLKSCYPKLESEGTHNEAKSGDDFKFKNLPHLLLVSVEMATKTAIGGFVLIAIGLLIVIIQALNMSNLLTVEQLLRSLGLVLIGIAVQLLGLGLLLVNK